MRAGRRPLVSGPAVTVTGTGRRSVLSHDTGAGPVTGATVYCERRNKLQQGGSATRGQTRRRPESNPASLLRYSSSAASTRRLRAHRPTAVREGDWRPLLASDSWGIRHWQLSGAGRQQTAGNGSGLRQRTERRGGGRAVPSCSSSSTVCRPAGRESTVSDAGTNTCKQRRADRHTLKLPSLRTYAFSKLTKYVYDVAISSLDY